MYQVFDDHAGCHTRLLDVRTVDEVQEWACSDALKGRDALYRVFERIPKSLTSLRFIKAFSVLNGLVTSHNDVAIPDGHW